MAGSLSSVRHISPSATSLALGGRAPAARAPPTRRQLSVEANTATSTCLVQWLKDNGATGLDKVKVACVQQYGKQVDRTVAARPIAAGEVALAVPEGLVVTLDRVFEDDTVAELLTTNKLSEIACLALYLMYEKKTGEASPWWPLVRELNQQRARSALGVQSPLLWDQNKVKKLFKGSPVLDMIKEREAGIKKEYDELDTVWFMAGSLFNKYPYDIPTEAFSFEIFRQGFVTIAASIVHLQKVPLAKRFALVPLGPPLLSYSPVAKGMVGYDEASATVQLVADRDYEPGEPLCAWCGPQPNAKLLINYGVVDEANPFDKLSLTAELPREDPLFREKLAVLQKNELKTQNVFDMKRDAPLPTNLLSFMRLAYATTSDEIAAVHFGEGAAAVNDEHERALLAQLIAHLNKRLDGYATSIAHDTKVIESEGSDAQEVVAATLVRIEKQILSGVLEQLRAAPLSSGPDGDVPPPPSPPVALA